MKKQSSKLNKKKKTGKKDNWVKVLKNGSSKTTYKKFQVIWSA